MTSSFRQGPVVFGVVPHYGLDESANEWLGQCIASLLAQTTPLQAIIVVDDGSPHSAAALVHRFPAVTLMRNAANTGPFAILDHLFSHASADALLLQDSDDWSTPERLEVLMAAMRQWGADIVGCQERTVFDDVEPTHGSPAAMPREPRAVLLENPIAHTVNLSTALVSCDFARRIGGFSSGFRFGGDSDFVRRAVFGGVVRNVDAICYFRRAHSRSLTRAPATGFGSPARLAVQERVQAHARALVQAHRDGHPPDLTPLLRASPTRLVHVLGPRVPGL